MASAAKKESSKARDEADAPAASAAPAAKSRSPLLLILGSALLAAGLASGATWFLLPKGSSHAAPKHAAAEGEAAPEGEAEKGGAELAATYLELTPAFVVNLSDEESMRFLQVSVEVMARDPKVIDAVKTHLPRIRNALMLLFSQQTSHSIAGREAKEVLQKQALEEVQRALQAENAAAEVSAVYFTSLVMQ